MRSLPDQRWPVSKISPIDDLYDYFIFSNPEPNESNLELSLKNIVPLLREIRPDRIFSLGLQLDIQLAKLRIIEKQHKDDLEKQKMEIIALWLENSGDQSWRRLAEAVRHLGDQDQLASKLENNCCSSEVESNQPGISGMTLYTYLSNYDHSDQPACILEVKALHQHWTKVKTV